jgi:Fic family protein
MENLGFRLKNEAVLQTLTTDVLKSSEIEGEKLDAEQVRSSVARHLGMGMVGLKPADRDVEGVVEMMLDATRHYDQPLTADRLYGWHSSLFPSGRSGMNKIRVGSWRDSKTDPMRVISGPVGRERVHYEAPKASRLRGEMRAFLSWFNSEEESDWIVKAAVAHLWFVTIHPFDDGNGRIARAIADMALARSEGSSQRFYSMSAQIREQRTSYYDVLERTQKGTLDITPWMGWFLQCLQRAIDKTQGTLAVVLHKAQIWDSVSGLTLNERQRKVLNLLLEGFETRLTTTKWAKLTGTSHDSALRDIASLLEQGVLIRDAGGGRSTSYSLAPPKAKT